MKISLFLTSFLILVSAVFAQEERPSFIPGGSASEARVDKAKSLVLEYFRQKGDAEANETVQSAVQAKFYEVTELKNSTAAPLLDMADCERAANASLLKEMNRVYPILTPEQLQEKAAIKHPLYKRGDKVKVTYLPNPQIAQTVSGVYYGTTSGVIKVGSSRIRLVDMKGIDGNDVEMQKFDPEVTAQLRNSFIEHEKYETKNKRTDFKEEKSNEFLIAELKEFTRQNEANGYTFFKENWFEPQKLLAEIVAEAREEYHRELELAKESLNQGRIYQVTQQPASLAMHNRIIPENLRLNPEKILKEQAEAAKKKAEEEAKKLEEAENKKAAAEAEARAKKEAEERKEREKQADTADDDNEQSESLEYAQRSKLITIGIGSLIVLIVIAAVTMFVLKIKKNQDRDRFKKFYEGKGQVQKDFWEMAEADPEHFKYVAYLFPSLKEANAALARLTYIQTSPNGELRCARDIHFGAYPHQNGAVAFLGGENFHYAPWREASAVFPELPGAQYFKVSTEPEVLLDIPDVDKLSLEKNISIQSIGVEDITDEDGRFTRCYKYSAESKDEALSFLQDLQINEEGIVIHVETPEGIFGKDENGIFSA